MHVKRKVHLRLWYMILPQWLKNKHCLYFSMFSVKVKISEKPEMVLKDRNRMMNLITHASPKKRRAQRRRKENFCHRDVKNCTQYFMHGIKCSCSANKLKSILQWSGDKIKPTSWQYKVFALLKKLFLSFLLNVFLFICLFFVFCLFSSAKSCVSENWMRNQWRGKGFFSLFLSRV